MAERYKLPDALGGGEVEETEAHSSHNVPESFVAVNVATTDGGSVVWYGYLPRAILTPVKPPTPEEPEVGAWLIGDVLAVRWHAPEGFCQWSYQWRNANGEADWTSDNWDQIWKNLGGSDVTITRLVPERVETVEQVELPWELDGDASAFVKVDPDCSKRVRFGWYGVISRAVSPEKAREISAAFAAAASRAES